MELEKEEGKLAEKYRESSRSGTDRSGTGRGNILAEEGCKGGERHGHASWIEHGFGDRVELR